MLDDKLILFDGAMGSMLNNYNLMGECNELYNITHPNIIMRIHSDYYKAGAEYIKTNTFGASPIKLRQSSNDKNAYDINIAGYNIARKTGAKVCGNIGPCGELYTPMGEMSTLEIYNSYLVQALALKDCDCILIETVSSIVEANLAYMAIRQYNKQIPIIISFTYNNGYTMMGNTPELVSYAFNSSDITAIGTNCSGGPIELLEVTKRLNLASNKRISVMPNAGLPILEGDKTIYPFTPEQYKDAMKAIVDSGASIIGGCCGTTPEHIKLLAKYKDIKIQPTACNNQSSTYIATEREYAELDNCRIVSINEDEILDVEDKGYIARIDVSEINDNLIEYFDNLNTLSSKPKCFIARKDQEQIVRILYHGITDIIVK